MDFSCSSVYSSRTSWHRVFHDWLVLQTLTLFMCLCNVTFADPVRKIEWVFRKTETPLAYSWPSLLGSEVHTRCLYVLELRHQSCGHLGIICHQWSLLIQHWPSFYTNFYMCSCTLHFTNNNLIIRNHKQLRTRSQGTPWADKRIFCDSREIPFLSQS